LTDHDPALGHRSQPGTEQFAFPDCGDARPGARLGAHDGQGADRVGAAHPIGRRTAVRLELLQRPCRAGPEDAVDPPAVEADPAEAGLQFGDVVAAQVGRGQEQEPIAQVPAGFDERGPGLFVADPVTAQSPAALEGANRLFGGSAKKRRLGAGGGWKPGGTEAALQIAYCLAALTGCQREVGRNSLSSCNS